MYTIYILSKAPKRHTLTILSVKQNKQVLVAQMICRQRVLFLTAYLLFPFLLTVLTRTDVNDIVFLISNFHCYFWYMGKQLSISFVSLARVSSILLIFSNTQYLVSLIFLFSTSLKEARWSLKYRYLVIYLKTFLSWYLLIIWKEQKKS